MDEYKKKTNTGDDVFIRIQHQQQPPNPISSPAPTAVLLGWLASKPKHVAKYATIFESMGYNTVVTVAPASVVFPFYQRTTAIYCLSILRILASDERLTAGGVLFQLFSNGGAINAPQLCNMFEYVETLPRSDESSTTSSSATSELTTSTNTNTNNNNNININKDTSNNNQQLLANPPRTRRTTRPDFHNFIKADDKTVIEKLKSVHAAIIFDSSPVYLHAHLGYGAINEGLGIKNTIFAHVVAFFFIMFFSLQYLFIGDLASEFWHDITNAKYVCPELYIYSRMDKLLDVKTTEGLIEHRKRTGRNVRVWRVDDAPHVAILRKHPEKYRETIQAVNEWGINAWRKQNSMTPWVIPTATTSTVDDIG